MKNKISPYIPGKGRPGAGGQQGTCLSLCVSHQAGDVCFYINSGCGLLSPLSYVISPAPPPPALSTNNYKITEKTILLSERNISSGPIKSR